MLGSFYEGSMVLGPYEKPLSVGNSHAGAST